MPDNQNDQYAQILKKAWILYYTTGLALTLILVFLVASDYEEMFFFGIMTPAAAYVFRPTERFMSKQILKYTGVAKPAADD